MKKEKKEKINNLLTTYGPLLIWTLAWVAFFVDMIPEVGKEQTGGVITWANLIWGLAIIYFAPVAAGMWTGWHMKGGHD
jgi:hypothetical protein